MNKWFVASSIAGVAMGAWVVFELGAIHAVHAITEAVRAMPNVPAFDAGPLHYTNILDGGPFVTLSGDVPPRTFFPKCECKCSFACDQDLSGSTYSSCACDCGNGITVRPSLGVHVENAKP